MNKGFSDKDYVEPICKALLEICYPNKFSNLIKSERPDFYNDKCFVEVRRIILNEEAEFLALFKKYKDKNIEEIPIWWLNKLGFNIQDLDISNGGPLYYLESKKVGTITFLKDKLGKLSFVAIIGKVSQNDFEIELANYIFEGLSKKLNKLQDYDKGEENDIIFYIEEFSYYGGISYSNNIFNYLKEKIEKEKLLSKYDFLFDYVYLFFNDLLIVFNLKQMTICDYKNISQNEWNKIKQNL